jgi:diguanylate cyclase (GGDEF)-like protein
MLQDAALALGEAHRELETVRGQLELQAHTDALTDLANRRMFELQGQQAFFHAQRYGEAMSVIVLDIDHFKRINDQFGHEGGDVVLRALGRYLKEAVRASERPAARIGGEEFAILVSHSTEEEPLLFA